MPEPRIIHCSQQGDFWDRARCGRITSSRFKDMMAQPISRASKRGPAGTESGARDKYRRDVIKERATGRLVNHFVNEAMLDGTKREPFARMLYEAKIQEECRTVGFVLHPVWDWFGCSPDGIFSNHGAEFKCPTLDTHISYLLDHSLLLREYKWQSMGGLICFPDLPDWSLSTFHPEIRDEAKLMTVWLHREECEQEIKELEERAFEMNEAVEDAIRKMGLPPTVFDIMPGDTPQSKPADLPSQALLTEEDLPQWWRDKLAVDERE